MQLCERERVAADRRTASRLVDIVDDIHSARNLVEAAWMAADHLSKEEGRALAELLNLISERLTATADALAAHNVEGHVDAA